MSQQKRSNSFFSKSTNNKIENQGENASINSNSGNSVNVNILSGNFISFVLVGIIALGGLAWGLGLRFKVGKDGVEFEFSSPEKVVDQVPASGKIEAKIKQPVEVSRVRIELKECKKIATQSISCHFLLTNKAGDRNVTIYKTGSRIIEVQGYYLNPISVQISNSNPSSSSRLNLISGIPTEATFSFRGVAAEVDQVAALEAKFRIENSQFNMQYRNVPLN